MTKPPTPTFIAHLYYCPKCGGYHIPASDIFDSKRMEIGLRQAGATFVYHKDGKIIRPRQNNNDAIE